MKYVSYPLDDGFIANWLGAGPQVLPGSHDWEEHPGISGAPVERGPLGSGEFHAGPFTGVWAYHRCPADHHVDLSGTYPSGEYVRSWAYAEIVSAAPQPVTLELTSW